MYPLIDMHIYSGKMGQKLAFVVNPGGDPKDIQLQLTGQDQLDVDIYGNLKILLEGKWVVLPEAVAYQVEANNSITAVNWTAEYQVDNGQATVRFNFDLFDHSKPLVFLIGPAALGGTPNYSEEGICWSTYYGGSGEEDGVLVKANDSFIYLAGNTSSPNIPPVEPIGSYHQTYQGDRDRFVAAFKANTGGLVWATYLGGNLTEALGPKGLAASKDGDVFLTGTTKGLPTLYPGPGWHDDTPAATGSTGFIARFKGDETFAPLWISYLGGGQYHFPWCITVDTHGTISVGGYSDDPDFEPVPRPGYYYQPSNWADGIDGFITQFDDHQNRVWNTHFGGLTEGVSNGHIPENIMSLTNINGTLYATGYTEKHNVPVFSYFPLDNQDPLA